MIFLPTTRFSRQTSIGIAAGKEEEATLWNFNSAHHFFFRTAVEDKKSVDLR